MVLRLLAFLSGALCGQDLYGRYNYASFDCGSRILATNPGAKSSTSILLESSRDSYLRNLCSYSEKWVVVELCQEIKIDTVVLGNYEYFSSNFKDVQVEAAKRYPPTAEDDWRPLGRWEAQNIRSDQVFLAAETNATSAFCRYIRVSILSHYGSEYFCPLSVLKVYGKTMIDEFAEEEDRKKRKREREVEEVKRKTIEDSFVFVEDEPVRPIIKPCVLQSKPAMFNTTCYTDANEPRMHAIQLFKPSKRYERIVPMHRSRPVFPIPMKPSRKTVIRPLVCPYRNPLQWPICSAQYSTTTVLQRDYIDPDRVVVSDLRDFVDEVDPDELLFTPEPEQAKKHHENIFKSLSGRLDTLEKGHTKHALLLQAALQRFEYQIDQILSELDINDADARSLEAYRQRLQQYLIEYIEERMVDAEKSVAMERDILASIGNTTRLVLALAAVNVLLLFIICIVVNKNRPRTAYPPISSPLMSPIRVSGRDQAVPLRANSLERVEQALMEASPLLLFDPETDIVDGIYTASPKNLVKEEINDSTNVLPTSKP